MCKPSPHSHLPCCSNTLSFYTVTAVTNVTLYSVIVWVTIGGLLLLVDRPKWKII